MSASSRVAIIGAGPYGLSVAAHLRGRGIDYRIFGKPLQSWRNEMPKGMFLKSEGFATNLYDPDDSFTLKRFCAENRLDYADENHPVSLDTFVAYSTAFQQKMVPEVEDEMVTALERTSNGFRLSLDNGEVLNARHVVVAAGLTDFRRIPPEIAHLPQSVLSHAAEYHDMSPFAGRDVTVIGGGASALDVVASLRAAGAKPRLVARRLALKWNMPIKPHPWNRLKPMSGMGGGWRNYFFEHAPMVFRHLPQDVRLDVVRRWLGPAGAWPARKYVEESPVLLGQRLRGAEYRDGRIDLRLITHDGVESSVETDHIIAATGFKVDLKRLRFLDANLAGQIASVDETPVLSGNFESTVPGLHFVGLAAANTFGPVMRFLLGARFSSRRLARHFAQAKV